MTQKQWRSKRPGETKSIFKLAQSELSDIEVEVLQTLAKQLDQELTSIDMASKEKRLRVKIARKEYIIASMEKQQRLTGMTGAFGAENTDANDVVSNSSRRKGWMKASGLKSTQNTYRARENGSPFIPVYSGRESVTRFLLRKESLSPTAKGKITVEVRRPKHESPLLTRKHSLSKALAN